MAARLDRNRAGPGFRCTACSDTFRSQQNGRRHIASCRTAPSFTESQGDEADAACGAGGAQYEVGPDGDCGESSGDDEDMDDRGLRADDEDGSDNDPGIEQCAAVDGEGSESEADNGHVLPRLDDLHKEMPEYKDAKCVDGDNPVFAYDALGSDYFPWRNLTEMLVGIWAIIHRPSRKSLQMLLDLLRFVDGQGSGFNPKHVPRSSEHLISRMRKRLPHLPVFERIVKDKEGEPSRAFDIPFNLLLARMLSCSRVVEEMCGNFGGHVLSASERAENNVPDNHIAPVATELHDKACETHLNGELLRSSSHMGLEFITVGGQDGVRVMTGDTVMAVLPRGGGAQRPCRLAAIFWRNARKCDRRRLKLAVGGAGMTERLGLSRSSSSSSSSSSGGDGGSGSSSSSSSSDETSSGSGSGSSSSSNEDDGPSTEYAQRTRRRDRGSTPKGEEWAKEMASKKARATARATAAAAGGDSEEDGDGHLVVRVNRLLTTRAMGRGSQHRRKRRKGGNYEDVWELTNDPIEIRVDGVKGLCSVLQPGEELSSDDDGAMPAYCGQGFVERKPRTKTIAVVMEPWRREGHHGWFFDRRSGSVHSNLSRLPVFSTGLTISSDGFNYFTLGGKQYSVNATYVGLGCLSPALLRRLRSWQLASLGVPGAAWEMDVLPLMKIISRLQAGCKAEIAIGDKHTIDALVRMGLLSASLDSPMHSAWTNQKHHNGKTTRCCQACGVTRIDLGNHKYDVVKNASTSDSLKRDLARVAATVNKAAKAALSQSLGVVEPRYPNPLDEVHFDRVEGCGMDILHQSALNVVKKVMKFVLEALEAAGTAVFRARFAERRMQPPNIKPLGDITTPGGFAALTGQELWVVSSVFPILLAPIFCSASSLDLYVRDSITNQVAERIGADPTTRDGKTAVCQAFQDLVKANGWSAFVVRSPSFTADGLVVLQKSQRDQVKQVTKTMGITAGTIHKGLHIARNVVVNGVVTNCNVGEAKHKEIKSKPPGSGRDPPEHIMRVTNDGLAVKALADGVSWTASGWAGRKWVRQTVTAGALCQATLRELFDILPLAPARAEDGAPSRGRPAGYVSWEVKLGRGGVQQNVSSLADWQASVSASLPTAETLEALYIEKLGCHRVEGAALCDSNRCASCWGGRPGLFHGSVVCFNMWGDAPEEASAGTGTLRGGVVKDAARLPDTWTIQPTSRGNDVELYVDADARGCAERGQGSTTLGKIIHFFEHQENDSRHIVDGTFQEGEYTIWVGIREYVTARRGNARKVDVATGCDVFTLRRAVRYFPASCIRSTIHMVHACATKGDSPCRESKEGAKKSSWECTASNHDSYLLNKYFHSFGRGPIA